MPWPPAGAHAARHPARPACRSRRWNERFTPRGASSTATLNVGLDRTDITNVHIGKVPIKPAFEINGEFDFQPYRKNGAFMDGNIALKPNEINIDGIRVKPATYFATNIADHMNSQ